MIWLGTKRGLFSYHGFDARRFSSVPIQSIVQVDGDRLFVGADNGLSCFNLRSEKFEPLPEAVNALGYVRSLLYDGEGTLWIGTRDKGLARYDIGNGTAELTSRISDVCINHITNAPDGNLLLGTDRGLYIWDKRERLRQETHDSHNAQSIRNNVVLSILRDRSGNFWLATDRGISITRPQSSISTVGLSQLVSSSSGNVFSSMLHDRHGDYWLGGDNGLIHIASSDGQATWFSTANASHPLRNNQIRSIYEDRDGEVWIATDASIARYDRRAHGFQFAVAIDGQIVNTAAGGAVAPLFTQELRPPDSRNVTIELSTLDYSVPDEINIYYQLDGNSWQPLGKGQNKIAFATLPYGTSTLRLCNANPEMSPQAAVLLRQWRFTISEVMYMVGYSNASYFTRSFTAEFGITPKQYINTQQQ